MVFRSVESERGKKKEEACQGSAEDGEERETSQASDRMRGSYTASQGEGGEAEAGVTPPGLSEAAAAALPGRQAAPVVLLRRGPVVLGTVVLQELDDGLLPA